MNRFLKKKKKKHHLSRRNFATVFVCLEGFFTCRQGLNYVLNMLSYSIQVRDILFTSTMEKALKR